jgi:isochorismate hydrolase
MEESYASMNNIKAKTKKWMRELERYEKRRDDFHLKSSSSALMVIDMQEFFLNEGSHAFLPASKAIIPNVEKLLNAWRKRGRFTIFTRHALKENEDPGIMDRWWADVIRDDDPSSRIVPSLKPNDSELLIRKKRYSAFQGTNLEEVLRGKGIDSLVITGVMTHLCCESTAREAFMKDFEVYFVIDGTAAQSEEFHISSLRALSDGFAIPVTAAEVLRVIEGNHVD